MKNLALLGSTGSIGRQVLDVVSRLPDRLRVVSMAANRNVELLAEQVRKFKPSLVSVGSEEDARQLGEMLGNAESPAIYSGAKGLEQVATHPDADITIIAVAGAVGLAPTIAAILAGKDIALASKEVLVAAGSLVTNLVKEKGVQLRPIDSEHSAIFQCLQGQDKSKIRKLILTASGGAFAKYPIGQLKTVTVREALAHPTWNMGPKITVDSATLMNKGLEIIEARWLFDVDPSKIEVVIHPQSIVHSMVEFEDGSVLAQMGIPDMRLPIQYAILYPERVDTGLPRLDIAAQGLLTFEKPDPARYPALELAYSAAEQGGTMPAVMNAANEVAVGLFLDGKIGFLDIERKVRSVMDKHEPINNPDLAQIL
ncbi:MAG: 1-deoxy-D-xylulose-5-phosphate reductoisomerase, partial [Armatimonadota bacterium]|nr:1-deoxy-D-xylulose-5-phosphate reductoisomerase [Armatimonadota bacterium]